METYEYIDHTADLGLRAYGQTVEELFINAADGMLNAMVVLDTVDETTPFPMNVSADSLAELMVAWLDELIFQHEVEEVYFRRVEIQEVFETRLKAVAYGEPIDSTKHVVYTEIKSVTYHQLIVEQMDDGRWMAQVIFDL